MAAHSVVIWEFCASGLESWSKQTHEDWLRAKASKGFATSQLNEDIFREHNYPKPWQKLSNR